MDSGQLQYYLLWFLINLYCLIFLSRYIKINVLKDNFKPDIAQLYLWLNADQVRINNNNNNCLLHNVIDFENKRIVTLKVCRNETISIVDTNQYDSSQEYVYFNNNNNFDYVHSTREDRTLNFNIFNDIRLNCERSNDFIYLESITGDKELAIPAPPGYVFTRNNDDSIMINRRSPCNDPETRCHVRYGDYCTFYARLINPEIEVPEWNSDLYNEKAKNLYWLCSDENDLHPILRQCKIDRSTDN